MGIRTKFNLVLVFAFTIGLVIAGYFSYGLLQKNAREEVLNNAGIMMETSTAIRGYTVNEIRPLLSSQSRLRFLPQTVPAYAATQNFKGLRQKYPDYSYKEATLNPTNPVHRATDWETDIIEWFRKNKGATRLVGERNTATGPALYFARPITITNEKCLACHSTPEEAPKPMLARYGNSNGFGWKLNETVGSQIVSIPMSVHLTRARNTFYTFMGALLFAFVVAGVLLNILLHIVVIRPVINIATMANDVSLGKPDVPELVLKGRDEISSLAQSFNRMRRSLFNAMNMLDQTDFGEDNF